MNPHAQHVHASSIGQCVAIQGHPLWAGQTQIMKRQNKFTIALPRYRRKDHISARRALTLPENHNPFPLDPGTTEEDLFVPQKIR